MPPRVLRAKTRLARRTPVPVEPLAAPPPRRATSRDGDQKEDEEEEKDEEKHGQDDEEPRAGDPRLFHGHRFYLARTLRAERRHELRLLIAQNGGDVVAEMAGGSIEIVERGQLRPGEDWVAADFVEDSIRDGELKAVTEYMAPREDRPQRTPSGRPLKRFFTVNEQAAMLRFLKEHHPKYYNKPSVPERIWRIAADQQLIDRTSSSMHEHYRKQLVKLTKKQRAVVFERAGVPNPEQQDSIAAETEGETESETVDRRPRRVAAKAGEERRAPLAVAEQVADEDEQDVDENRPEVDEKQQDTAEEEQETVEGEMRANKAQQQDDKDLGRSDAVEAVHPNNDRATDSEDEIEGRAKKRAKRSSSAGKKQEEHARDSSDEQEVSNQDATASQREGGEAPEPPTSPPADQDQSSHGHATEGGAPNSDEELDKQNEQAAEEPETPGGEVFHSYWHDIAFDPTTRHQLDRFFIPPPLPPNVESSQNSLLHSAAASAHRTPQRSRRLSNSNSNSNELPASHSTPTPQKRRRGGRASMDSTGTPGSRTPSRAAQEQLLSQLEEMVGQRMTPPSRRKSLDRLIPVSQASERDADELMSRLQFETGHDLNTICSALYWSSGDSTVARAFLLGHAPVEVWSPKDDRLLVDYMREDVTEAELANARHRGVFETMSSKRTTRDILRRIQFLL